MKPNKILFTFFALIFLSFTFIRSGTDFTGTWEVETENLTFTLYLKQINNKITGNHSIKTANKIVYYMAGWKTICACPKKILFILYHYFFKKQLFSCSLFPQTMFFHLS
jgi:uncharacterized membrane protein